MVRPRLASKTFSCTKGLLLMIALLVFTTRSAQAHRLDEYLQATILSVEPGTVHGTLRMVPGVAVASAVLEGIDSDHNGIVSQAEEERYARHVLSDLRLEENGVRLDLQLDAVTFPAVESMKLGTGEVELAFSATLPFSHGRHELTFENHHQGSISVYLVNSLVPQDRNLQLISQARNPNQSIYRATFAEASGAAPRGFFWSGFGGAYRLGLRHIAEGTDHLLFLLTLLLPAPLLVLAGRWKQRASVRQSLVQILSIVTAFTLGHSLTLALSVFGIVQVPSRPIELLIAVSILISALHALRPLFPGHEAVIAASFGLVHGLAFASALNELGVAGWYRLISLLGFNLGVETMQLVVVAVTLPALILLSRTQCYVAARVSGGLFAVVASVAWIAERTLDQPNIIGQGIARIAQHGVVLACTLWGVCLVPWLLQSQRQTASVNASRT